jgi:hypothetical protein
MEEFYEVTIDDIFSPLIVYELDTLAKQPKKINKFLETTWEKHNTDILLQVYFIRSKLKNKENAQTIYKWIANNDIKTFNRILPSIVFYGEWKDLFDLYETGDINKLSQAYILIYICKQMKMDYESPRNVSRLINNLPRERSTKDRIIGWVDVICEQLKISRRTYRKMIIHIKTKTQDNTIYKLPGI